MSEILRKPRKLLLHGICKIPAGKAGKAAAKQYANERKARKRALARLAEADSKSGVGLLVMLTSADRRLGRYIFKKLDKVIPFYVKALSDETSGMSAEEMSWLMDVCERRGYRTLWLDLAGVEKLDKRAVLHLVAGELIRMLEEPAPERALEKAEMIVEPAVVETELEKQEAEGENEPETAVVEELIEPEMADAALEMAEVEVDTEGAEESATGESVTGESVTEEAATEEAPAVEAKPAEEEKSAAEENLVPEEKPAPRRRSRKTSTKAEGEKVPAKPRRKRAPAAPLTVEATLAKRRRQMGLE